MAFPPITTITCTGQFYAFDGSPATGWVTFEPSHGFVYADPNPSVAGSMLSPTMITAVLDGTGAFTVSLPCPDDPNLDLAGVYTVTEHIAGGRPPYQIAASYAGGNIDLSTVTRTSL